MPLRFRQCQGGIGLEEPVLNSFKACSLIEQCLQLCSFLDNGSFTGKSGRNRKRGGECMQNILSVKPREYVIGSVIWEGIGENGREVIFLISGGHIMGVFIIRRLNVQ